MKPNQELRKKKQQQPKDYLNKQMERISALRYASKLAPLQCSAVSAAFCVREMNSNLPAMPYECDQITGYLFHNYLGLLTDDEGAVYRTICEGRKCHNTKQAERLIAGGEMEFYGKVRDRLLSECRDEIIVNRCPRCDTIRVLPHADCRRSLP
jgi:hypothetical protein